MIKLLALSSCKKAMINYSNEDNIDEENLLAIIKELSSEKYMGRLVGTKENEIATQYIVDKFKEISLESPQGLDNYLQYFITQIMIVGDVDKFIMEQIVKLVLYYIENSPSNLKQKAKYRE